MNTRMNTQLNDYENSKSLNIESNIGSNNETYNDTYIDIQPNKKRKFSNNDHEIYLLKLENEMLKLENNKLKNMVQYSNCYVNKIDKTIDALYVELDKRNIMIEELKNNCNYLRYKWQTTLWNYVCNKKQ